MSDEAKKRAAALDLATRATHLTDVLACIDDDRFATAQALAHVLEEELGEICDEYVAADEVIGAALQSVKR